MAVTRNKNVFGLEKEKVSTECDREPERKKGEAISDTRPRAPFLLTLRSTNTTPAEWRYSKTDTTSAVTKQHLARLSDPNLMISLWRSPGMTEFAFGPVRTLWARLLFC